MLTREFQNPKFCRRGFILIEFLVATLLFSLAGSGLYTGFTQAIKADQRIKESFRVYDPLRICFLLVEKDLRNMVSLEGYPFKGKKEEVRFPSLLKEEDSSGKKKTKLVLIHYFVKDHSLIRKEEALTSKLEKEKPKERILLKNLKSFEFLFPYLDSEENRLFEPFWLEEPYMGIPRGVRVEVEAEKISLAKTVSIPQGKMGRMQSG